MTPEPQISPAPTRVSILARIVPALSLWIVMLGAAISALLIKGVINAMHYAESAGIAAVAGGMAEANLAIVISLYFAIFLMVIALIVAVVRTFMMTQTASPSAWWFAIAAAVSLGPLGLVWKANSLLMQVIFSRANIIEVVSAIQLCLTLALITAVAFSLLLLVGSVVPLPSFLHGKRSWSPIVALVLMEIVLIGLAVGFQMHMSGLMRLRESY